VPVGASHRLHFIFKKASENWDELALFTACSTWEWLSVVQSERVCAIPLCWLRVPVLVCQSICCSCCSPSLRFEHNPGLSFSLSFSLIKGKMVAVACVLFRALNPASADLHACRSALSGECQRDWEWYQGPQSYMDKPFVSVQCCEQRSDNVLPGLMGCG